MAPETPEVEALSKNVQGLFSRIIDLAPYLPAELELAVANVDTPGELTYLIASTMRLPIAEKQELLEEANVEARLRRLSAILSRELESFELGAKIQSQVQSEMEASQREYFLRQQLKAIQEELGEGDADQAELAELRRQLDEAGLPEEARPAGPQGARPAVAAPVGGRRVRRHPHVPRLDRVAARGTSRPRTTSTCAARDESSTRITTTSRR